jgi:hypothetical protein
MSTVNYANYNTDLTVRIFDEFYDYQVDVPSNEFDVVNSYFVQQMGNKTAAGNFTVSLFKVAQDTGIPVLTLLKEMQGLEGVTVNVSMAYYLNQIRSRATLLGVGRPVVPNFYQARNVLQ